MASTSKKALLIILFLAFISFVLSLDCEQLGLCSAGKVKSYLGDISNVTGLRAALEARSYNKEIIIALSSFSKLEQYVQLFWNFYNLGYEHSLLISSTEFECRKILAKAAYLKGCSWDGLILPHFEHTALLWHIRYRTLARVVRAGYNAWLLDSDIYFFHDPYVFLKSPVLKDHVIFHQLEGRINLLNENFVGAPNGGFMYVQNARPNGPAAWYIAEITYRVLREIQDGWQWMRAHGVNDYCALLDQETMNDILPSLFAGAPMWQIGSTDCYMTSNTTVKEQMVKAVRSTVTEVFKKQSQVVQASVPLNWQPIVGSNTTTFRVFTMQMPNVANGKYPDIHGFNLFATKGNLSESFKKLLMQDCSGCPLWPDPEDPSQAEAARNIPTETMVFLPEWFVLTWYTRGRLGYWDVKPVQQVAGHMNFNPITTVSRNHKKIGLEGHGLWNWSAAREVKGINVFLLNFESKPSRIPLVAYSPSVDFGKTRSIYDLHQALIGLAQVASLTYRAVLWPDLPCSRTPWLRDSYANSTSIPRFIHPHFFPWGKALGNQSCMWWLYTMEPCSSSHRGLTGPEFPEYQHMYGADTFPSPNNTIFSLANATTTGLGPVVKLRPSDVKQAITPNITKAPVIYLDHIVFVDLDAQTTPASLHWHYWTSTCQLFTPSKLREANWGAPSHPPLETRPGHLDAAGKLVLT